MNAPASPRATPTNPPSFGAQGLSDAELLILSAYFHPEPTGSAPPITDLAFWLAENGARTRVVTARPSYPRRQVFEGYRRGERDLEVLNGVETRRLAAYVSPSRGIVGRLRTELSIAARLVASRLRGEVARSRHVVCVCPSTFVVLAAPLFRAPGGRVLCIVHDLQSGLARGLGFGLGGTMLRAFQALERRAFDRCDVLVALSEEMAREIRKLGVKTPVVVIPPQVDVREIVPRPEPAGPPTLIYSGNLGRKQGLDQVLDLARELKARRREVRILIRGEGSERAKLEEEVRGEDLDSVEFQDLAPRARISEALAEGAIHLAPQHPEGAAFALPSKIFSIMAAQRPFLATANPGTPLARIARESGAGVCVRPYDTAALAGAAIALLDDPWRRWRMGAAGRAYVEDHIDREVVCRAIWRALSVDAREARAPGPVQPAAPNVAALPRRPTYARPLDEPRTFGALDEDDLTIPPEPDRRPIGRPEARQ